MKLVCSSGHGLYVRGAAGPAPWGLDEVNEARRVVERTADYLRQLGVTVTTYHDDVSRSQNENLNRIVDFHNSQGPHELDVSVHFNAYQVTTSKAMGTECWYVTQETLAGVIADNISDCGFVDRGPKYSNSLFFLSNTAEPAVLVEVCFVDSKPDCDLYRAQFESICVALAESLSGIEYPGTPIEEPPDVEEPPPEFLPPGDVSVFGPFTTDIKCSVFGGVDDPNNSAYPPYDMITDQEFGVALPFKFPGNRPWVLIQNLDNGREVVCAIRDIGPWMTDDDYWERNRRPLAETCSENQMALPRGPNEGRVPNGAGIDITPNAAREIGLAGMGQVSWRFVPTEPTSTA